jgi:hypothetical protein
MAKNLWMVIVCLTISMSSVFANEKGDKNFNLRGNSTSTHVGISGGFNTGFGSGSGSGCLFNLNATRYHKWYHYGMKAGGDMINKTLKANVYAGPKFGNNFYVAPAITFGLGQVRTELTYQNLNNEDKWMYKLPQPNFFVGGQVVFGYNFGTIGIFLQTGYERAFSFSQTQVLEKPWVEVERKSAKDFLNVEVGFSYIIDGKTMMSGDNCLIASIGGGYSSMGHFMSVDLKGFARLGYSFGHSYGGVFSFYTGNGNAEIGAKYDLNWHPGGSNGRYNASIGISAVVGQYSRTWTGSANDDPERLSVGGSKWSLGGGVDLEITPVAVQLGRVNLALFGSYGFRALTKVKGSGDLNYNANTTSNNLFGCWKGGLKVEFAF